MSIPAKSPLFRSNLSQPKAPSVFWITEHVRFCDPEQLSYVENPGNPPLKSLDSSPLRPIPRSNVKRPISIVDPTEQRSGNGLSALARPFVPARKYPIILANRANTRLISLRRTTATPCPSALQQQHVRPALALDPIPRLRLRPILRPPDRHVHQRRTSPALNPSPMGPLSPFRPTRPHLVRLGQRTPLRLRRPSPRPANGHDRRGPERPSPGGMRVPRFLLLRPDLGGRVPASVSGESFLAPAVGGCSPERLGAGRLGLSRHSC